MAFFKNNFKLRSQAEIDAEQKKKDEEKIRQHWLSIERSRKEREQYEIKEISGWMYVGPFVGLLVAGIAGVMIWLSGEGNAEGLWWVVGIGLAPLLLFGFTSDLDDKWKASVAAKREIEKEKDISESDDYSSSMTINGFEYKYEYIYTDSAFTYWFYKFTKFVMGLSTIGFGILAAILLFMWLGSISIAPTTIIIILLVIIIMNQNKSRE
ncbi:MAG: hypothetical protein UV10_C0036G0005 [Candidatus Azambacteria bacterium GW2011_GWA1_42_19]|uniref:Uncharacterized protein n=1 Tax=Candidatus Azambacteria bacterium GW2011_GWA1_42_19 TaxID=1618609 RepID=A0A0G1BF50_9BACT|nr:MAG: hypothetical protein UV10_C0036G0005 [Candidatus Azambacteria bacterium GW2011_GWA1_42_19]